MILIISDESDDSTNDVINWINYYRGEFIRINRTSVVRIVNVNMTADQVKFEIIIEYPGLQRDKIVLSSDNIKAVWYRRGFINIGVPGFDQKEILKNEFPDILLSRTLSYKSRQYQKLSDLLYSVLSKKWRINRFADNFINKVDILHKASEVGIRVPETIISTQKSELIQFYIKFGPRIIVKAIEEGRFGLTNNSSIAGHTYLITEDDFTRIAETFDASLFQEYITKEFEVRSFYLNGKFYSSAIFSQQNSKTEIDFRNYDHERPNRVVPIRIPKSLEKKIIRLFDIVNVNCGSIDMVYTGKEFYFLEINPFGQYGFVSLKCNYYLDEIIAKHLLLRSYED